MNCFEFFFLLKPGNVFFLCVCVLDCGRSFVGHRQPRNWTELYEGRIINGKKSLKGAWPWQV